MSSQDVAAHYSHGNLLEQILGALRAAGKDLDHLSVEDLAPADHFHTLGLAATIGLADAAELRGGEELLDVGCGPGGPARILASRYGCRVTAVDVTPEYCRVAQELNRIVGLEDRIVVQEANALALPFADRTFDVVWTMHVTMNIEDKATLYDQFARVLKQDGKLAFFDLIHGSGEPLLPVPWANDASLNHLVDESELRLLLSARNFHVQVWDDLTDQGAEFFGKLGPSPLGPHLLISQMPAKMKNLKRNLEEGRVRAVRCVCTFEGA